MRKILSLMLFVLASALYAKPIVVVSILPEQTFVQKITKNKVDITLMVKPGSSPHSYEPKSSQMKAISKADIYFKIDADFEKSWVKRFKSQNKNLKFINICDGVKKIPMTKHHHEEHNHHKHDYEKHQSLDPHTWTSPKNVAIMAQNIYKALVKLDPANKNFYKSNLDNFIKEIQDTDAKIKDILKDVKPNSKFMVFHPAWGYFAKEYSLIQLPVEVEGKSPKPKELIELIKEAKKEGVKAVFTQPEFSDKSAKVIAKEVGVPVVKISPLSPKWSKNLIHMAKNIANEN